MHNFEADNAGLSDEKRELLNILLDEETDEPESFPLSFAQQRLWFLSNLEPDSPFYNVAAAVRLTGGLHVEALAAALNEVVRRHEVLRTTFAASDGEPVQLVAPSLELGLEERDVPRAAAGAAADEELRRLIAEEAQRPFDLTTGPLVRAALLRVNPHEHVLVLTLHHIISDGWSLGVLVRELGALYEAFAAGRPSPLDELELQYADFAQWQREWLAGDVLDEQLAYWKRQLGGGVAALEMPTDRPRPSALSYRGASLAVELSPELSAALKTLSQGEGTTLYMTLLAAFQTLLHRYTRQTEIVVGTPIANRNHAEIEDLIGFFVNTLVLRTSLDGDPTFRELLARVREVTLGAYANQDVPFEKLVEELQPARDMGRNPFFQVLFALQNAPLPVLDLPNLRLSQLESDGGSTRFDLEFHLREEGDRVKGALLYSTDLFDETTARRLSGHFRTLLEAVAASPDERVSALPLMSGAEQRRVLEAWNDTAADYPRESCLQELFEEWAERTPDGVAVESDGARVSYAELNRRANRLARRLRKMGVGPDAVVAVMLERSPEMMSAVLAVLKAGGAYLPLDPTYPQERLAFMLEDSGARVLLTQESLAGRLPGGGGVETIRLDADSELFARESDANPRAGATPDNLAYVIYTSGSTGRPKGVMMPHRPLVNLVAWQTRRSSRENPPRTLQFTSLSFDVSFQEIFTTWLTGATLVLVREEVRRDAGELLRVLIEERVERLFLPFVALQYLAEAAERDGVAPPRLREVITAGEQLKVTRQVRALFGKLEGGCTLDNQYGPTEAHVVSSFMLAGGAGEWPELPPIGRPVANARLYVLDEWMRPVPVGVTGELFIGGEAPARGYLGRAGATAERFVPDPFSERAGARLYRTGDLARYLEDGDIEFLGRGDHQVKVRGYRVEVGEIETALRRDARVRECVVVARGAGEGEKRLVAYVQTGGEAAITPAELRERLGETLPEYMMPAAFVFVGEWPLTPSGKVDRRRLPVPDETQFEAAGAYVAPRTPAEELLAGIWAQVLGVGRVGARDNFFDLGGHSLLATRLMSRVEETFGVKLPLRRLFETPTPEGLARTIEIEKRSEAGRESQRPPLRPTAKEGTAPLSFAQQRLWFIEQLGLGGTAYSLPGALRLRGALDVSALARSINEIVRRHEALRTTFTSVAGEPVQVVAPFAETALPLADLGASPEAERESEVMRLYAEEAARPFDLARGPLLRVRLLRLAAGEHVLLLNMHHIVSDGWSIGVMVQEIAALYRAFTQGEPSPLAELPVQYADYARWQREWLRGDALERQLSYWRRQLEGANSVLALPTDRPRPAVQSWHGARHRFTLPAELSGQLRELARRERVTLYMLLLAAFQTLLYRYTRQDGISVGSPIAGRHQIETEGLIGLFINMLVMRTTLDDRLSFAELLGRVRRTALDAYANQDLPFERLVEELQAGRDLSHTPLFQVMFVLHNDAEISPDLPGLNIRPVDLDGGAARFDLTLELAERGDVLEGWFEYKTDLFDASTIARMEGHLQTLLAGVAADPARSLGELPLLGEGERHRLLSEWNDTRADYPADRCVHELFEAQARRTPHETAVVFEETTLSYRELNARANQLAHHLRALGVGRGARVGLCVERSAEMVVGLLGILKAGAAYVPLDPAYPRARLALMLEDSRVAALLTQEHLADELPRHDAPVVLLDADSELIARGSDANASSGVLPDELAYVIYTSGSTGRPKGVMVGHRNVSNFFAAMDERVGVEAGATWLAVTSISFDISVLELLWTLARGFKVVVQADQKRALDFAPLEGDTAARPMDFSLFYFASSETAEGEDKYKLLMEGARFADEHGFSAVWTPERHFHNFGGLYPNPSVIGAALAAVTKNISIRAGSVVLPLHNSLRVAEEWSVVDNISGGRVGVSFASGWHADDFVFAPDSYERRQEVMYRQIEEVRQLWRGEPLKVRGGAGNEIEVRTLPRPVQAELPVWVTAAGSVETFRSAGRIGAGLLTHLLGQSTDDLASKIEAYREAWREGGREGEGHVTLMLHTFVGADLEEVREQVRGPFCRYLMQSLGLARNLARSLGFDFEIDKLTPEELSAILSRNFDRYFETSGLLGTPESCLRMIGRLKAIGVDEVACLIDFGVEHDAVVSGLRKLSKVRERSNRKRGADADKDYSIPAQIERHRVTHLQCTPSMARVLLADARGSAALGSLRKLLVGGEELPASLAAQLGEVVTGELHNMYGPTETTIWSTTRRLAKAGAPVTIGRPVANTEIYILDPHLRPVPVGVHGELFIGGEGVVRGYLDRPALTAERFVPDPFDTRGGARLYRTGDVASYLPDGDIQFLGRADNQVKLRGYRIELGEVESALARHPEVREAAVVAREDEPGEQRLVAYVVPARGAGDGGLRPLALSPESESLLGERPRQRLPNGMVVAHHSSPQTGAIYREIFEEMVYARHGITFNEGDTIFDVGSNIGLFTLFAARACGRAHVYAFEPIPPTFDLLRTNVALYGVDAKVFEMGLADRVATEPFVFYPEAAGLSGRLAYAGGDKETTRTIVANWYRRVAPAEDVRREGEREFDELLDEVMRAETYECRLTTLSNVMREQRVERIDLLKVDVEGGELDVFNGIEDADWARIKQVVAEIDTAAALEKIRPMLETRGFSVAVDETTVVEEGRDYVYTLYATRQPRNGGNGNGSRPAVAEKVSAPALTAETLRGYMKERLPDYMVPSAFVMLGALPQTPNGKVDRKALPAPSAAGAGAGAAYVAPRNEAEQTVSSIWQEVLGVERVGIHDNFFDLGGNSLLLVKAQGRLQDSFARDVSMVELFRRATVSSLAEYLSGEHKSNVQPALEQAQGRASRQAEATKSQRQLVQERARKFQKSRQQRPRQN